MLSSDLRFYISGFRLSALSLGIRLVDLLGMRFQEMKATVYVAKQQI